MNCPLHILSLQEGDHVRVFIREKPRSVRIPMHPDRWLHLEDEDEIITSEFKYMEPPFGLVHEEDIEKDGDLVLDWIPAEWAGMEVRITVDPGGINPRRITLHMELVINVKNTIQVWRTPQAETFP